MEIVSPVLNSGQAITKTLSEFWEAMSVHFDVKNEKSCGGHVHVTPSTATKRFSMEDLRTIAFATVYYEHYVYSILPITRRTNEYCQLNTKSDCRLGQTCRLGISTASLGQVSSTIKAITTGRDLYNYMQGRSRYVLWNFQNIFPHPTTGRCSGTVEFRGGSQFLNTSGTLRWLAFVLAFISLALEEVCSTFVQSSALANSSQDLLRTNNVTYQSPSAENIKSWWKKVRQSAKTLKMMRHLPEDHKKMEQN